MINKEMLKVVREDINAALKSVGEKHGLSLELGNIKFSSESFEAKLEAQVTQIGNVDSKQVLFNRHCKIYGFTEEDYLRTFDYNKQTYILTGFKPSSTKYTLQCENTSNNKGYGFPVSVVREIFDKEA